MPSHNNGPSGEPITTEEELDTALQMLLASAHENDVAPEGSWVVRNGSSVPDWEVQVFELAKRE